MPAIVDAAAATRHAASSTSGNTSSAKSGGVGITFDDLIDVINPLQHIPIISSIYRAVTGDAMSPTAEIAGGALFGGIVGAVSSIADVIFTQATGKRFGDGILAWLGIGSSASRTQLAEADTSSAFKSNIQPTVAVDPAVAARTVAYRNALALKEQTPSPALSLNY